MTSMPGQRWLGVLGLLAAVGCGREASPDRARPRAPAGPAAILVESATMDVPLSLPAQLYVERDVWLHARSSGVVESIFVDVGSAVRQGQVVAQLEHADQDIALGLAQEEAATAQRALQRLRGMAATRLIAPVDSEQVETERRRAELALRQAQRNLDLTQVVAPFGGVVAARLVRPHRLVAAGDTLLRVSALAPLLLSVRVPDESARGIEVGRTSRVLAPGGAVALATVIRASPVVDAASGTREFVLQLAPGARMQPGSNVTVRLGATRRPVIAIPADVVVDSGYVMVEQEGRTLMRAVTLGMPLGDGRVEVTSGLAPGERIVRRPR